MMPRCQASSGAAAEPNRREQGGRGGGENDKHEHGGSWGQLKIAQGRGGESEGESAGTMMKRTWAGLFLVVLRMNSFCSQSREGGGEAFTAECMIPSLK